MFRNQYDTDVTTWSPAGRLFQVEYAMEAVKQGSAAIGLRSKTHVVLACVNKSQCELSSHQRKIFKVDDHIGVAIAGLTADGRVLSRYMRSECINYSFTYESSLPVGRLVVQLADKAQVCFFILLWSILMIFFTLILPLWKNFCNRSEFLVSKLILQDLSTSFNQQLESCHISMKFLALLDYIMYILKSLIKQLLS